MEVTLKTTIWLSVLILSIPSSTPAPTSTNTSPTTPSSTSVTPSSNTSSVNSSSTKWSTTITWFPILSNSPTAYNTKLSTTPSKTASTSSTTSSTTSRSTEAPSSSTTSLINLSSTTTSTTTAASSTTVTSTMAPTSNTSSKITLSSTSGTNATTSITHSTNFVTSSTTPETATTTPSTTPTTTCETNATTPETTKTKTKKASKLCTDNNIAIVGRIVFGEARGEIAKGQLAVAWTVVNRVNHAGYPNTLNEVVFQKYGSNYQYNTLGDKAHTSAWKQAKKDNSATYKNAIAAARAALCKTKCDPTGCATDYCARDPCSATNDNKFYKAYNKVKIGNHWFVCRRAVTG